MRSRRMRQPNRWGGCADNLTAGSNASCWSRSTKRTTVRVCFFFFPIWICMYTKIGAVWNRTQRSGQLTKKTVLARARRKMHDSGGAEIRVGYSPRPPPSSWIWPNLISWPHWHHHRLLGRPHQTRRRLHDAYLCYRAAGSHGGAPPRAAPGGDRGARHLRRVGGEPSRRCLLQGAQRRGWRDRRFL